MNAKIENKKAEIAQKNAAQKAEENAKAQKKLDELNAKKAEFEQKMNEKKAEIAKKNADEKAEQNAETQKKINDLNAKKAEIQNKLSEKQAEIAKKQAEREAERVQRQKAIEDAKASVQNNYNTLKGALGAE